MSSYATATVQQNGMPVRPEPRPRTRRAPSQQSIERQETAKPNIWIRTSARRSSIARLSVQMRSLPAYLIYFSENGVEQRFDITQSQMRIGRRDGNDLVLQCLLISKDHAVIEKDEHGYYIRDENSANGITINEHKVNIAAYLEDGDEIQIGSVTLKFFDEIEMTESNWREVMKTHPSLAGSLEGLDADLEAEMQDSNNPRVLDSDVEMNGLSQAFNRSTVASEPAGDEPETHRVGRRTLNYSSQDFADKHLSLVTILPSEKKYEESITVRAEIEQADDEDFLPVESVKDTESLKTDYEKLRLAFELSKTGLTEINTLLDKTLDLMFSVLPVDRGVVLLVDRKTGMLTIDKVKLREGRGIENKEILLSHTVLMKVFTTRKALITSDACEDPLLGKSASIALGQIRSVLCLPLLSRGEVHGILHLDSKDRLNAFAEKDLALVKAIANQAGLALENVKLVKDIQNEVSIRENLGRFLPPHVVEKVISKGEEPVRKGGRDTVGTILFADIRGFTDMSERSSPQEVVDMLNDFFERLVQIVFKYDGVLDKYIGDCLMADFGTLPGTSEDSVIKAVCAALEFKVAIADINHERKRMGKEPITVGIGLNTGHLVAGYIGSSQRLEYTCIGDAVNTASRICAIAEENQVLVSEDTFAEIRNDVDAQFVGSRIFKGKSSEVAVYEVVSVLPTASIVRSMK